MEENNNKVLFITGNEFKVKSANLLLENTGIEVIGKNIECPEIQHEDVVEIAKFSAKFAANKIGMPIIKNDCGFYIEELKGFPGPFMAYVDNWIGNKGFLKLMEGITNRKAKFIECTAYCEPGKEPIAFVGETNGIIAEKLEGEYGWGSDFFFIPEGKEKTMACFIDEERGKLWTDKHWKEFAEYMRNKNK
ncbi:MAG: non-canonical purine NTP pyrophosphatase [Nanoarchaeota archaeon]|nr:non-canonical purine NTP pyrophosphatase [Nanoarchaeota archaeon]